MKNKLLSGSLYLMILSTAYATNYRCLPFDARLEGITACDYTENRPAPSMGGLNSEYESSWTQHCQYDNKLFSIHDVAVNFYGIARCGSYNGGVGTLVAETLDEEVLPDVSCYCKMVAPVVSQWVRDSSFGSAPYKECSRTCAHLCATAFAESPDFRQRLVEVFSTVYEFTGDTGGIMPAEDVEFFVYKEVSESVPDMNITYIGDINPENLTVNRMNTCPQGSSVFAINNLWLSRRCNYDEESVYQKSSVPQYPGLRVGKVRSCLETWDSEHNTYRLSGEYNTFGECSMYIPDVYSELGGHTGEWVSGYDESGHQVSYRSICGLSEG